MSKEIQSPVKRFSGTVVLPDALTFPQYRMFSDAIKEFNASTENRSLKNQLMVPGVLACVSEWHLANIAPEQLTPETFPSTPYIAVNHLLGWLIMAINALIFEADDSPNA